MNWLFKIIGYLLFGGSAIFITVMVVYLLVVAFIRGLKNKPLCGKRPPPFG
jgi:hypothetical protein